MRSFRCCCTIACCYALLTAVSARCQDAAFKSALELFQAGSVAQARHILLGAVAHQPTALDYSLLGSIDFEQGRLRDAELHLRKALKLTPGLPGTTLTLANVLMAEHQLPEALALLESAHQAVPTQLGITLALARARNLSGNSEGALAILLSANQTAPDDSAVLYGLGVLCLQMDLIKDANTYLERAVKVQSADARALYALGSARIANHNLPGAIEIYRKLLDADPLNAQISYALGTTYFLSGNAEQAKALLHDSIKAAPDQVESYYYLALLAQQDGDNAKSIDLLHTVILLPIMPAHLALGLAERSSGQLTSARNELERAIELAPQSQKAHYQLGLVFTALKEPAQAKAEFDAAGRLRAATDDKVNWELAPNGAESKHDLAQTGH